MTDTETELEKQERSKNTLRRDLVPLIVILIFAIVMTIVAVTVWQWMMPRNEAASQPVRESMRHWLLAEECFFRQQYPAAIDSYTMVLEAVEREKENGKEQSLMPFLTHLRMAESYLRLQDAEHAEEQLKRASSYRAGVERELNGIRDRLEEQLREMKEPAGERKEETQKMQETPK